VGVSVVIVSDNHAPFLAEAMESALTQTVGEIELVVVDCGSTDRSPAVAESVIGANPGASIELVSEPDGGHPAHARNRGVDAASGEYVVCLDPYDKLAPDFVERCAAALDDDPVAGFAYTDHIRFGATNGYDEVPDYDFEALIRDNFLGLVALFRRSAWEACGGFDAEIPYDDWDFWIGCADSGHHGVKVAETAWHHRVRTNGRFRGDAMPEVRRTRAELVRKRPHLYSAGQHAWAEVVLADETVPAAAARSFAGVLPTAQPVAASGVAELLPLPRFEAQPVELLPELKKPSVGTRGRPTRDVNPDLAAPGELVFHVGAGEGDLTAGFLELGASVLALEPDPLRARRLRQRFGRGGGIVVLERAVGSWEGAHESAWPQPMLVQMTTLARLIERHGTPVLCKVEAESFADHVLAGLDRPLACVGFRFNANTLREARLCAWRLAALGMTEFNYTLSGGIGWESDEWFGTRELYSAVNALERRGFEYADAYARPRD
jgi:GT2 family glycosyltransferase